MRYSVLMALAPWEKPWVVNAALKSLERQSQQPTQLIVSTDGKPTEELSDVLKKTQLPLLKIEGPGGEGAGPVLQRGLNACTTELVVRADADDINEDNRCETLIQTIQEQPQLAVLGSYITEFSQDGPDAPIRPLCIRAVPVGLEAVKRFSRWRNPMNHQSTVLRVEMVRAVGGYRSASGFEDYDLWLRLLAKDYKIDNINTSLVMARVGVNHRRRRRGLGYIKLEYSFGMRCLKEKLMTPWMAVLWLAVRLPTRLLSTKNMDWLIKSVGRRPWQ